MASPLLSPLLRITRRSQLVNLDMVNTRHGKRSRNSDDEHLQPVSKKQRVRNKDHSKIPKSSKIIASVAQNGTTRSRQPSVQTLNEANIESKTTASKRAHFDNASINGDGDPKKIAKQEKRTLRSRDGVFRTKSDLSLYFPGYEEMLSNEPKTPGRYSEFRKQI
jgi:hypothetical protein